MTISVATMDGWQKMILSSPGVRQLCGTGSTSVSVVGVSGHRLLK
jgi:hypothetical protein